MRLVVDASIFVAEALRVRGRAMLTDPALDLFVPIVPSDVFAVHLAEAGWRIPRDPADTPVTALARALDCGIWTNDRDCFGCGLPVWTTDVLLSYLAHRGVDQGLVQE
jgi:hypothetical protein